MADIFISYASDEKHRIEPLAEALEHHGFSVWWDNELRAGETFDEVIEREIETAACVIVCWSSESVGRRWVRTEANEALERDALVPIFLEKVRPPIAFRLVQAEDFSSWRGSVEDECWKRLILQVDALVARSKGRAADPAPDVEEIPEEVTQNVVREATQREVVKEAPSKKGPFRALGSFTTAGAVCLGIAALFNYAPAYVGISLGPEIQAFGLAICLAVLIYFLFAIADREISPQVKSLAGRWLMPIQSGVKVSGAEAFNGLFEATFGRNHFSLKCMWRSATASLLFIIVALTLLYIFTGMQLDIGTDFDSNIHVPPGLFSLLFLSAVFLFLPNVVGDYVSLFQTRIFLRWMKKSPGSAPILVVLDAILSAVIYVGFFILLIPVVGLFFGAILNPLEFGVEFMTAVFDYFQDVRSGGLNEEAFAVGVMGIAATATTYLTSVWLWLVLLFGPASRALLWSKKKGPTLLGKVLGVQRHPFRALGATIALLTTIFGGAAFVALAASFNLEGLMGT
ncbi:MAG: toll/interleukin-1 receptor domain-containing protein [Pseudomonadota bacterium]